MLPHHEGLYYQNNTYAEDTYEIIDTIMMYLKSTYICTPIGTCYIYLLVYMTLFLVLTSTS